MKFAFMCRSYAPIPRNIDPASNDFNRKIHTSLAPNTTDNQTGARVESFGESKRHSIFTSSLVTGLFTRLVWSQFGPPSRAREEQTPIRFIICCLVFFNRAGRAGLPGWHPQPNNDNGGAQPSIIKWERPFNNPSRNESLKPCEAPVILAGRGIDYHVANIPFRV